MEVLKRERSVARKLFTKAKNEVNLILQGSSKDRIAELKGAFKHLSKKADNLFEIDLRIKKKLLSSEDLNEDDLLKECESADVFEMEWTILQCTFDKILNQESESKFENISWRKCQTYYPEYIECQKRHAALPCPKINTAPDSNSKNTLAAESNGTKLPKTLLLKVGEETIRAFIDTGAQRSYIRRDIAMKLKLRPIGEETLKHYLFGGVETSEETHQIFEFNVKGMNGKTSSNITALSKEKICGYIPRIREDSVISKELKSNNVILTDIGMSTPDIVLLIGADCSGRMMTELGWTLQGMVPQQGKGIIATVGSTDDISHIEEPKDKALRKESERQAIEDFKEGITIDEEGRYEVDLPWKIDLPELLQNRELAEKRLRSTTMRLESLNELENYDKVFKECLELGIIEVEPDVNSSGHYLCHHAVFKESSLTSRVRPVFDASAKYFNANSIACLEKGHFLDFIPILLPRYSVNGANFVGAANLLTNNNWDELKYSMMVHNIKWINPPAPPWWGGWWGRLTQMEL